MSQTFVCERLRLCHYLTKRGFRPYDTVPDKKKPGYLNWLFEATPELTEAINDWFSRDCYSARMKRSFYAYTEQEIQDQHGG